MDSSHKELVAHRNQVSCPSLDPLQVVNCSGSHHRSKSISMSLQNESGGTRLPSLVGGFGGHR